jgi:hypothetical protein
MALGDASGSKLLQLGPANDWSLGQRQLQGPGGLTKGPLPMTLPMTKTHNLKTVQTWETANGQSSVRSGVSTGLTAQ